MLLEKFPRIVEGFPPRSEEGFPLGVSARPSDVSLGELSRRLLILGSTKDDVDGTTLPCVSIMGCPLKELGISALSASPRRLTEGALKVEGPTSTDAGVVSCLLFDTETEFRRLRDDFLGWDGLRGWHEASWWDRAAKKRIRGTLAENWSYRRKGVSSFAVGNGRDTMRNEDSSQLF